MPEAGKVVVITGAGSGMGRASSLKLAKDQMKVVLVDFDRQAGEETLNIIKKNGGEGMFINADVSKNKDVQYYVNQAIEAYGRIDVFFNNAGVIQKPYLLADIPDEEYDRVASVNFEGVFYGMKYVLKVMEQQNFGVIINNSSSSGLRVEHSLAVYSASKHAVVGLTKAAAKEYANKGIRINAICPGGIETNMVKGFQESWKETGNVPDIDYPLIERMGNPNEIANVVAFLASSEASYMTGSIVAVEGGLTL